MKTIFIKDKKNQILFEGDVGSILIDSGYFIFHLNNDFIKEFPLVKRVNYKIDLSNFPEIGINEIDATFESYQFYTSYEEYYDKNNVFHAGMALNKHVLIMKQI